MQTTESRLVIDELIEERYEFRLGSIRIQVIIIPPGNMTEGTYKLINPEDEDFSLNDIFMSDEIHMLREKIRVFVYDRLNIRQKQPYQQKKKRKPPTLKPRICRGCNQEYVPTGNRQIFCEQCRKKSDKGSYAQ